MSFKTTWWLPSAVRFKGYQRYIYRAALVLAPILIAIGIAATLLPFVHEFVAVAIAVFITLLLVPSILTTSRDGTQQVEKHLNDTDYLEKAIIVPETGTLSDLAYFPSSKEWLVLGHIDPTKFIKEIQSRDTLASSFDTEYLSKYVQHVNVTYEYSPKLKRQALKIVSPGAPTAQEATLVRIPPTEYNEIRFAQ